MDNELHAWCLAPGRGLLRFHSTPLNSTLESCSQEARESVIHGEQPTDFDENSTPSRNHLNASSYSLSSLFSVGSVSSRTGSAKWGSQQRGMDEVWQAPAALQGLYEKLLSPFEDLLPAPRKELVLVVERGLYLAPLPALQADLGL